MPASSSKSGSRTAIVAAIAFVAGVGLTAVAASAGLIPSFGSAKLDKKTAGLLEQESKALVVARIYSEIGPTKEATETSMEGIARTKEMDVPFIKLANYANLMHTRVREGQLSKSESTYKNAQATFEQCRKSHGKNLNADDALVMAYIEIQGGKAASQNNEFDKSKARFEKAAELAVAVPNSDWLKAYLNDRLMLLCHKYKKYDEAEKYGEEALAFVETNGNTAYGGDIDTEILKILCNCALAMQQTDILQKYVNKGLQAAGQNVEKQMYFQIMHRMVERGGFGGGFGGSGGEGFARGGGGEGSRWGGGSHEGGEGRRSFGDESGEGREHHGDGGRRHRRGGGMFNMQQGLPHLD